MDFILEVKNLRVKGNGKEILKGVDLKIRPGEAQALLGPNACGKSTLAQVIAGNPKYGVVSGEIFFNNKKITSLPPEKRVNLGIVLAWQNPPKIKGVKLSQFLKEISPEQTSIGKGIGFSKEEEIGDREINTDLSGGERKMSELAQVLALRPRLAIFDEIDSGLDLKRLEKVAQIIKKELLAKQVSVLLITHSGEILRFLKPQITNVMVKGRIICREKDYKKVFQTIKKYSYEKCKTCKLLAG